MIITNSLMSQSCRVSNKKTCPADQGNNWNGRTFNSPRDLQKQMCKFKSIGKEESYTPYIFIGTDPSPKGLKYYKELVLPGAPPDETPSENTHFLPVKFNVFRTMVDHLVKDHPKVASKELAFIIDEDERQKPGLVQVTLLGTTVRLSYNQLTGEPMEK